MLLGDSSAWVQWVSFCTLQEESTDTDTLQGYPMAVNLRKKIPKSDTLTVFDVNQESLKKITAEEGVGAIQVATDPKELAQKSVC